MLDTPTFTPARQAPDRGRLGRGRDRPSARRPRPARRIAFAVGTPDAGRPRRARGRGGLLVLRLFHREDARRLPRGASPTRSRRAAAADHRDRHRRKPACPPARLEGERGRTTGQLRLFAAPHPRRATISTAATTRRCPTASPLPRPGPAADPAADRPGRGVRRLELPAGLLDRRRRHRRGAGRRLPGGGQGPLRPSRHRRDRRRGDPRRDRRAAACHPGVFSPDPGRQPRRRRGAGPASADQGGRASPARSPAAGRCSTSAPRGPSRSRSSASSARSTRCSCCPRRSPRAARRSARAGPGR